MTNFTERDLDAIHQWARRLLWPILLLIQPWLPHYPRPPK